MLKSSIWISLDPKTSKSKTLTENDELITTCTRVNVEVFVCGPGHINQEIVTHARPTHCLLKLFS